MWKCGKGDCPLFHTLINVPFYYAGQIITILKQALDSK